MKTSFYFVMWICIYPILELTGVPFLQENSFFVAFLVVMFAIPHLTKKIFEKDIVYSHNKHVIDYFETIYTNNIAKIKKRLMTNIILNSVVFVYFVSYVIGILLLGIPDALMQYIIFGVLSLLAGSWIAKNVSQYMKIKDIEEFDEDNIEYVIAEKDLPVYESYKAQRAEMSYEQMLASLGNGGKMLKITSIVFAIVCTFLGLVFVYMWLPLLLFGFKGELLIIAMVVYASMAVYYGINDLIESIRE